MVKVAVLSMLRTLLIRLKGIDQVRGWEGDPWCESEQGMKQGN